MKKTILTITLAMLMLLTGCSGAGSGDSSHPDSAMQAAYDASLDARDFADGLLKERLAEQGVADYTIDTTAGGFITSDPIVYTVGYCYTHDGQTEVYGYKLSQSESGFDVIAEGTEIGEVVTGTGE